VLVSVFRGPRSFTGEDSVEISCHGSVYIQQTILQLLLQAGARQAQPGEFTQRAFLNGRMDLSQAEAVADLIASESEASHRLAMHQMRGGFSKEIGALRQQLIDFASLIELELDFAEEDVEFANRAQLQKLVHHILDKVNGLARSFQLGNVIKNGIQTVIAGRPNAGKSTLLNALLEEERAIVSDIPGTTRDTIEETLNINGVLFRLIDTAGIREATDTIEAIGVEKTLQEIGRGTILVYLYDVTALTPEEVQADLDSLVHDRLTVVAVANKRDKVDALEEDVAKKIAENIPAGHLYLSGKSRLDTEILKKKLYDASTGGQLHAQQVMVTNVRHYEALRKTGLLLDKVLLNLDEHISGDLLAMDIRQALYHLGEITGEVTADDLLGNIFGKFCIGK
jgi:tRNA modification GTPase